MKNQKSFLFLSLAEILENVPWEDSKANKSILTKSKALHFSLISFYGKYSTKWEESIPFLFIGVSKEKSETKKKAKVVRFKDEEESEESSDKYSITQQEEINTVHSYLTL